MKVVTKKILIVEDDPGLQKQLRWCFEGFEVFVASDRVAALELVEQEQPQVVMLDLGLPPDPDGASEGLATLEAILKRTPLAKVVMVTGNQYRENALKAMALGAYDFYEKPVDSNIVKIIAERAFHVHELEEENAKLVEAGAGSPLPGIIATSPEMLRVCREIEKVAPVDVTTVLFGESGTGKELLARAVHSLSPRAQNKFVAINCAAIPENLLESELFGYEKGAFTGATKRTIGKIEHACGGTLMLDEIGDLPESLQSKLLRFLQERVIERLGGRGEIPVNVRVVAASHQDLKQLIEQGRFREDLYYRLSEVTISVPPLRDREGDAVAIAKILLHRYEAELGRPAPKLSNEAVQAIEGYAWPGNIRELENRLKRAMVLTDGKVLSADDIEIPKQGAEHQQLSLKDIREKAEREASICALRACQNNVSQAAKMLKVSRPTLYDLMQKYGLK